MPADSAVLARQRKYAGRTLVALGRIRSRLSHSRAPGTSPPEVDAERQAGEVGLDAFLETDLRASHPGLELDAGLSFGDRCADRAAIVLADGRRGKLDAEPACTDEQVCERGTRRSRRSRTRCRSSRHARPHRRRRRRRRRQRRRSRATLAFGIVAGLGRKHPVSPHASTKTRARRAARCIAASTTSTLDALDGAGHTASGDVGSASSPSPGAVAAGCMRAADHDDLDPAAATHGPLRGRRIERAHGRVGRERAMARSRASRTPVRRSETTPPARSYRPALP